MRRWCIAGAVLLLALAIPATGAAARRPPGSPGSTGGVGGPGRPSAAVSPTGLLATLGEAIRRAHAGDTIVVLPGVYREPTIIVDRPLVIVGRPGAVLDGAGVRAILVIRADDVVVRGLGFRNVGVSFVEDRAAIRTEGVRHCLLEGNRIEDAFFGIYLARTADCVVRGNVIEGHATSETLAGNGIHLWYSRAIAIEDNRVRGHRDGIYLEFVVDSRLRGNASEGNLRYGLHFMFSDSCVYRENLFRHNSAGVAVMYTRHVVMEGNRFEDNWGSAAFGLLLKDISDSRIAGNTIADNTVGIYAEGSNRLVVERNRFLRNGWALRIMADCERGLFAANDFVGNTFDVATNSTSNPNRFAGNFWDRYRGYDLARDGTGDVPFHPVRLFSMLVEQAPPALLLLRSPLVAVLDAAESAFPSLTPEALVDAAPRMHPAWPPP